MVFCSRCGREGAIGQLYCTECGTKIVLGDTIEQRAEVEDLRKKFEGARAMHDSIFRDFTNLKREYQNINLEKSNLSSELKNSNAELKKVIEAYRTLEASLKEKDEKLEASAKEKAERLGSIEQQYQALQSKEAQVSKAYNDLVPKYHDVVKERDSSRAELDRIKRTYADEIERARRAGAEDKEKSRRTLQTERDDLARNYEALKKEHEHVISEKADLNAALQSSRTDLKKMADVRQELEGSLKELEASAKEKAERLGGIEQQYQALQSKEAQVSKAYNDLVPKYNNALKERDIYRKGIADHKKDQEEIAKLRSLVKTYEGLQVRFDELDQAHNAVLAERDGLRVELENSKDTYDEEHRKYTSLEQENRALLETYAELSRKNEDTEKELEGLKSDNESQKRAIRDLELRVKMTSEKLNETERQHRDLLLQHLELTSSYERLLGAAKQAMREREQIKVSKATGADQSGPREIVGQEVKPEGMKTIVRANPEKKED